MDLDLSERHGGEQAALDVDRRDRPMVKSIFSTQSVCSVVWRLLRYNRSQTLEDATIGI